MNGDRFAPCPSSLSLFGGGVTKFTEVGLDKVGGVSYGGLTGRGDQRSDKESVSVRVQTKAKCVECGRVFDLLDEDEASEFYGGHDCEEGEGE